MTSHNFHFDRGLSANVPCINDLSSDEEQGLMNLKNSIGKTINISILYRY